MSKSSGLLLYLIFFLVSTPLFSSKLFVFGSRVREQSISRPDPINHFKSYNGGYDIRNKHYWASLAFTGVHGYALAGVWLLCGVGFGVFMIVKHPSRSHYSFAHQSDFHFMILLLLFFLFTILAILAINFVLVANRGSFERTKRLKDTILGAGRDAWRTIRKVIKATREMQHLLLSYDPTMCLQVNLITHQLSRESRITQHFVHKDGHFIDLAIQMSYIGHILVVTINLIILLTALVLVFLHWHPGIITVLGLNEEIKYFLGVWKICDPFSGAPTYGYIPNKCPKDAIPIGDLPNVLARFVCYKENSSRGCKGDRKFLPRAYYDMARAYTRSVQDLLSVYPDLQSLARCSLVKDMVSDVVSHQCRPLRLSIQSLWSSMLFLSIVMVVWVIVFYWLTKMYQARY